MALHRLLLRQLAKLSLKEGELPADIKAWQALLDRISHSYMETDQERYTLERSMNISSREMLELNERLTYVARCAGMAEVATTMLHNVGNILNSANVSMETLQENIERSRVTKLKSISQMLQEHLRQLPDYLTTDPKGKLLPEYIIKLADVLIKEYKETQAELKNMQRHLIHIKSIVALQQTISGISGVIENVSIPTVIETALQMCGKTFETQGIQLIKDFSEELPVLQTDKSRLLQILVNLLQNAKEALLEIEQPNKKMIIRVSQITDEKIQFVIQDNGIGILPENKTRVFSLGFTTKKEGHGFGLHSSAIAAKELGGALQVESEGESAGATFMLTVPIHSSVRRINHVK